jgi:DNA-binding response OmpR family regulator
MKLLLIEQDPNTRKKLERVLSDEFIVDSANTGQKGEDLAYSNHYDVVLTDMILPDTDGDNLCALIKSKDPKLPVVLMSRSSIVEDKVRAFNNGADDYITKPVNTRELKARLRASIRKLPRIDDQRIYKIRELVLDLNKKLVTYGKDRIDLRRKEMQVLEFLMINEGRVVSRMEILEHIWDVDTDPFTNTVEVHIKRLRDKIEKPYNEKFITTRHGIGYMFE